MLTGFITTRREAPLPPPARALFAVAAALIFSSSAVASSEKEKRFYSRFCVSGHPFGGACVNQIDCMYGKNGNLESF
jgi:hypothetical protein